MVNSSEVVKVFLVWKYSKGEKIRIMLIPNCLHFVLLITIKEPKTLQNFVLILFLVIEYTKLEF